LIGIRFNGEPFQCAAWLNRNLKTNFVFQKGSDVPSEFGIYEYTDNKKGIQHMLYVNRSSGNFRLRSLRGYSYLWLIKGDDDSVFFIVAEAQTISKSDQANILIERLNIQDVKDRSSLII
jgi:hypothetical protein